MPSINDEKVKNTLSLCFSQAENLEVLEEATKEGDQQFTSNIKPVTIQFKEGGVLQQKSLLLKIPNGDEKWSAFTNRFNIYDREILAYEALAAKMNALLEKPVLPASYFPTKYAILVLENLATRGYEICRGGRDFLDLDQCYPVLQTLAKFHVTSYAILRSSPHLLQEPLFQTTPVVANRHAFISSWQPVIYELLKKMNYCHLIPKFRKTISFLQKNENIESRLRNENLKFVVLSHGDYRKENLLFQYDSRGHISDVKIVDLQTCFWSSPAFDFLYFLTISTETEIIETNFETLVDWYVRHVNEYLKKLDFSFEYKKEDLMADIANINFVAVIFLLLKCTIYCSLDHSQTEDTIMQGTPIDESSISKYSENEFLLKNVNFFMDYFDKTGVFNHF